jgi:hypothetical protein
MRLPPGPPPGKLQFPFLRTYSKQRGTVYAH